MTDSDIPEIPIDEGPLTLEEAVNGTLTLKLNVPNTRSVLRSHPFKVDGAGKVYTYIAGQVTELGVLHPNEMEAFKRLLNNLHRSGNFGPRSAIIPDDTLKAALARILNQARQHRKKILSEGSQAPDTTGHPNGVPFTISLGDKANKTRRPRRQR